MLALTRNQPGKATAKADSISHADAIGAGMQVGISTFGVWMLGVGANIGSFAWLIHASMIGQAGPLASVLAWIAAAIMTVPLTFILAELSSIFPTAGGPYVYKYFALKRLIPGMGDLVGFITGWIFWIFLIACYACMSNGFVNLLGSTIWGAPNASPLWFGPVTIVALFAFVTVPNLLQVKSAARLNNCFTILKFGLAILFMTLAWTSRTSSLANLTQVVSPGGGTNLFANIALVLPLAMAGFSGTEMCGCVGSETVNARKSLPKAIMLTIGSLAFIYIGMSSSVCVVSPYALSANKTMTVIPGTAIQATAPSLAAYLGGPIMGSIVTAGVFISIVSCGFSGMLGLARTSLSMAETGLFPKQFAQLNPRTRVPQYALIFQAFFMAGIGICSYILARTGIVADAYSFLGAACGFLYGILAMLYGVCLLGLRYTDPNIARPFRIGKSGNALAWVLSVFCAIVFGGVAFGCTTPSQQLAGAVLLLAGLPVYGYYRFRPATVKQKPD